MTRSDLIRSVAALGAAVLLTVLPQPPGVKADEAATVTVVAGTGELGRSGDGGPALQALLNFPYGVAISPAGLLYFSEHGNDIVRRVDPDGTLVAVAGMAGKSGRSGDGGPATQARLSDPLHLAFDAAGNLFIADGSNNRIRKVTPDGIITTYAGGGNPADRVGDGGPATAARLNLARGLAVDAAGNLYIGDTENFRVRKVTPAGIISTVAGTGKKGYSGDGGLATEARLNTPAALAMDTSGNLYIVEYGPGWEEGTGQRVRKVSPEGIISTVAGSGEPGYSGDGGPAVEGRFNSITGIAVDAAGNLFLADWGNFRVRKVDPTGVLTTVVGNGEDTVAAEGGDPTATGLRGPWGLAIDARGNLFLADTPYVTTSESDPGERILKITGIAGTGLLAGRPFPRP
jgi:sugar lactone lactonase YvrE